MGLVTIADLHREPPEVVAKYVMWAEDLRDMYEKFIEEDEEDVNFAVGWHGAKARSGGLHASEISGACKRPAFYSLTGHPREDKKLDPFWKKRFRVGHMLHGMIQEDWRRLAEKSNGLISFEREVRIGPDLQPIAAQYDIHSSSDGVLVFRDHPWGPAVLRIGLEIKTESPLEFEKIKDVKPQHQRQTCVYMRCLDVPVLWTMYVNKGNQNIIPSKYPYLYTFDFNLWNQIEGEAKEVIHLATIKELPPRTEGISCEFCGYSSICNPEVLQMKERRKLAKEFRTKQQKKFSKGLRAPRSTP